MKQKLLAVLLTGTFALVGNLVGKLVESITCSANGVADVNELAAKIIAEKKPEEDAVIEGTVEEVE